MALTAKNENPAGTNHADRNGKITSAFPSAIAIAVET